VFLFRHLEAHPGEYHPGTCQTNQQVRGGGGKVKVLMKYTLALRNLELKGLSHKILGFVAFLGRSSVGLTKNFH
jgi:hypothetical protein